MSYQVLKKIEIPLFSNHRSFVKQHTLGLVLKLQELYSRITHLDREDWLNLGEQFFV